jgi:hypothetical protein
MFITARKLKAKFACDEQVALFKEHWPKGTEVTEKALRKAHRVGLNLNWFAATFLSNKLLIRYITAMEPHLYETYPEFKLGILHVLIGILCPKKVK